MGLGFRVQGLGSRFIGGHGECPGCVMCFVPWHGIWQLPQVHGRCLLAGHELCQAGIRRLLYSTSCAPQTSHAVDVSISLMAWGGFVCDRHRMADDQALTMQSPLRLQSIAALFLPCNSALRGRRRARAFAGRRAAARSTTPALTWRRRAARRAGGAGT